MSIALIVTGNTSAMTTTGNSSNPSVDWEARNPSTHKSVRWSSLKVKPMSR